jgi:hypothetical protein
MAKPEKKTTAAPVVKKPAAEAQRFTSDRKYYGKNGKLYEPGEIITLPAGDKPGKYMKPYDAKKTPDAVESEPQAEDPKNEQGGQKPGDIAPPKAEIPN